MTTSELEPLPNLAAQPNSPSPTDAGPRQNGASTARASAQLARWSRARALRAGRRLERPAAAGFGVGGAKSDAAAASSTSPSSTASRFVESLDFDSSDDDEEGIGGVVAVVEEGAADGEESKGGKLIYMVSDGTGSTLEHAVGSALGQFEHLRASRVNTRLFSGINDVSRLLDVIKQAAKEGALLLYTLVDPSMTEPAKQACQLWNVPFVDILEPTTKAIASHLGAAPSGIPRSERKTPLTKGYFRRIEAIEFTIKQDDGALPQNLHQAHIVLLGVSRSGKTPLSIYLAQKGYKVANVPIVMGVDLPKVLFQINQEKVYGLLINPAVLHAIRKSRAKTLGFSGEMGSNYSEMDHVRRELDFASKLYAQNPMWPVIDMTGKAIEEIAAVIVRFYQDRKQKSSMPWISRRY